MWRWIGCVAALAFAGQAAHSAEPLPWRTLEGCRFVEAVANDGDSFCVDHAEQRTVYRLYFVDTFESDPGEGARRAGQARYFGMAGERADPQALALAAEAADVVRKKLAQPFTVVTRGDPADPRDPSTPVRAFVVTAGGEDLAEELVRRGLALIRGGKSSTAPHPDGRTVDQTLRDLRLAETEAHRAGRGAWAGSTLPESAPGRKEGVLAVTDRTALLARAGERVRVTGRVDRVATLPDGRITFLNFVNTDRGDFVAIVREGFLPAVAGGFPHGLAAGLVGRDVALSGVITVYRNAPQLEIEESGQIEILPEAASR